MPTSEAAAAGTAFHDLCEKVMSSSEPPEGDYDAEMLAYSSKYHDFVIDLCKKRTKEHGGARPTLAVEKKFNLKSVHEDAFGTNDLALYYDFGTLDIVDIKYGYMHVEVEENQQLMYYALGIIEELDIDPTEVVLHIWQPRDGSDHAHREWRCPTKTLRKYHKQLKERVKFIESNPEQAEIGKHCFFCNKVECNVFQEAVEKELALKFDDIEPIKKPDLTHESTARLLRLKELEPLITSMLKDASVLLLSRAEAGEEIAGMKLVKNFGHRKWEPDFDALKLAKKIGTSVENFYKEDKPLLTAPQFETFLKTFEDKDDKKRALKLFEDHIIKPENGVKLVDESAAGEAVSPTVESFEDIE